MNSMIDEKEVNGNKSDQKSNQNSNTSNIYTMLDFEWKDQYNTGISEIDYQHRYFLQLIRRIAGVIIDNKDSFYSERVLMELVYYAKFHFYSEENLMILYGYDNILEHKRLHLELIDQLSNKINFMSKTMDEPHHLIQFLLQWFVHHSMEEDKKIALFMK